MRTLIYIFTLYVISSSCKKDPADRSCGKPLGKMATREYVLNDFDTLEVYGNIEYIIVQDTINKAIVTAGENMINFIDFEYNGHGKLAVHNKNTCNFLRSYEKNKIKIQINFKQINNLIYSGSLSLINLDTITQPYFRLDSWSGNGKITLTINNYFLETYLHSGSADLYVSGKSEIHNLYSAASSFAYQNNYEVITYRINHSGTGNYYLGRCDKAEIYMSNLGDIYYQGTPNFVSSNIVGKGKLIQKND